MALVAGGRFEDGVGLSVANMTMLNAFAGLGMLLTLRVVWHSAWAEVGNAFLDFQFQDTAIR